jgi:hypothetical protein
MIYMTRGAEEDHNNFPILDVTPQFPSGNVAIVINVTSRANLNKRVSIPRPH